jgi:acetyl esterase/lipase
MALIAIPCVTRSFRNVGGFELCLDAYVPDHGDRARGAVIWLHGGALVFGRRQRVPSKLLQIAARDDFVVVSPDYRLAPQATIAEIADDVIAALRWVRDEGSAEFAFDAECVMVAGESAGGYLALLLGTVMPRPRAVLAYYGYGTLDSAWYTQPSDVYRQSMELVSERQALDAVRTGVVVDGDQRPDAWNFYVYCRQNGLWPKLVAGFDPATQNAELRRYSPTYQVTADFPETL